MARLMLSGGLTIALLDPVRGLDARLGRIIASVVEDLVAKEELDTLLASRAMEADDEPRVGVVLLVGIPEVSRFHPVPTLPPALNGGGEFFDSTLLFGLG